MKRGSVYCSAVFLMTAVMLLSALPAADGSGGCIESVSDDGVVDVEEADRIIAELQASAADEGTETKEVCLYSFGCPTLSAPSELYSAVRDCGAGMSVETRYGRVAFAPGSMDGMSFAEGSRVDVTVRETDPGMFYEDFAEGGLVTDVRLENCGDLPMGDGVSVSVLFDPDPGHSADDLEVYYLHGDRVCTERVDAVCQETCDGVSVTFGADRSGQYAVVYAEGSGDGGVNVFWSLVVVGITVAVLAGVAVAIRRM